MDDYNIVLDLVKKGVVSVDDIQDPEIKQMVIDELSK